MDKYLTVKKSARSLSGEEKQDKQRSESRYHPYGVNRLNERKPGDWAEKRRMENLLAPLFKDGVKPSTTVLRKHLLNTLTDESNPITHSDIYHRTDHITSMASGHQRSDGHANQSQYLKSRAIKLEEQLPDQVSESPGVLGGVRVYINGYLDGTTDIEMKRIVALAGGDILYSASGATHILTSQQLNGAKTQKHLTAKSCKNVQVVRPEWVFDSINTGKRLPERTYSVLKATTRSIADIYGAGSSRGSTVPTVSSAVLHISDGPMERTLQLPEFSAQPACDM